MSRIQGNIVARHERRLLNWACERMPAAVTSDHLTAFGVFGAVLVLAGYLGTHLSPYFLWLAAFGYVVHWLGDSLDGSLARYRNVPRPRYGYFLDHSLDAFCIAVMIGGMGLSRYVSLSVALFVVVAYFAMSIHVFLRNAATGTFQLSFMAMGPTELRMVMIAITLGMLGEGGAGVHMAGLGLSLYDVALVTVGTVLTILFIGNTVGMIIQLRALEGDGRTAMVPDALEQGRRTISRPPVAEQPELPSLGRPARAGHLIDDLALHWTEARNAGRCLGRRHIS